jgi:GNAT superfamily N-acetyltransferase
MTQGVVEPKEAASLRARIRVAAAGDNQALLELTRASPMVADISLCMERDPDFFALTRARGHGRTLVAECERRIVACGSVCRRTAYLMGEPGQLGHVADLKVDPQFRRVGLAQRIMSEIATAESERQPAPYVGTTAAGNAATKSMVMRFGEGRKLLRLGGFTSYQLLPLRRYRMAPGLEIGRAEPRDESELVGFLDDFHCRYSFAPVFRGGGLTQLLSHSPGMKLSSYRIARRRGRIVAAVAAWDASAVKRSRVYGMTARLRSMSWLLRTARKAFPVPPFAAEGELLRFVYLRHPAFAEKEIGVLSGLVRSTVNEIASQQLHFALFTCADGDPLAQCLKGIARTRYHYSLLAGANVPAYEDMLSRFRGTLLYDDAALS